MVAGSNPNFVFHPSCKALKLNHLMFADDVMIFYKAHPQTFHIIKSKLLDFYSCVGLHANHEKSQIVFGGCSLLLQHQCLEITDFQERAFPIKYLGVPITVSILSKLECRAVVENIVGKVTLWATKSISFASRAQLPNSVIFGMFNFWATIFILPQEVIDQMNQICRNYLWGDGGLPKEPLHILGHNLHP